VYEISIFIKRENRKIKEGGEILTKANDCTTHRSLRHFFPPAVTLKIRNVSSYLKIHQSQNFPFLEVLPGFLSEIPFLFKETENSQGISGLIV